MLWAIVCVVAWYAVAYYGMRDWQRYGFSDATMGEAVEAFWLWVLSPLPLIGIPALWCATRRTARAWWRITRPIAVWLFAEPK